MTNVILLLTENWAGWKLPIRFPDRHWLFPTYQHIPEQIESDGIQGKDPDRGEV